MLIPGTILVLQRERDVVAHAARATLGDARCEGRDVVGRRIERTARKVVAIRCVCGAAAVAAFGLARRRTARGVGRARLEELLPTRPELRG
eukprot:1645246-Prymnesium_polylepis.1